MKDLDAAGLDCLAALADERSFERAAEMLAITQSAVSQRLRSLEAQVGQLLVVRSRPLRLTEPGKRLLRYARQLHALRSDVVRELGVRATAPERLPIAVNADSLATWVLPALDPLVQRGLREGFGLELVVDDQDFTHDWLRQGEVLGCVTAVRQALRGCVAQPLGVMRYVAVASPDFVERELPQGLGAANFPQVPFLVFNRKDDTQQQWVRQALGLRSARLNARYVPSSEAYVQAVRRGWGVGVAPELQIRPLLASGELVVLWPDVHVEVALYWHQWKLGSDAGADSTAPPTLLDQIGEALALGAREALRV
ncbi:LysR family transcriptional regulator, chromosome initiation inhibitor [Roseateles sp. YR242]|uniref:LysR family transcriptional regulator ArgP n=1 Tax=Roseateles sp. YR242 TaxID=1855305 RepID=UPI0008C2AC20|nr:LysR family transcriptional regulator ArgP [Roseateles sp. YR242]SEK83319.1 LysR family transcriptional regulator, chromosome initiation inhibitor [Roseateles sp. YR242]